MTVQEDKLTRTGTIIVIKDLSIREYKCQSCGRELDRDINASINISFEGLKLHYNQANLF